MVRYQADLGVYFVAHMIKVLDSKQVLVTLMTELTQLLA